MTVPSYHKINGDIEALRGIGIFFVIVSHSFALFNWGVPDLMAFLTTFRFLSGVDLFFCVSGYVITLALLRQKARVTSFFEFAKPFWFRRVFRLWPMAWLWAGIILISSATMPEGYWIGSFGPTLHDFYAAILNYANYHLYSCGLVNRCGSTLFSVYWSLSLEEQFYVIYPIAIWFLPRWVLLPTITMGILAQLGIDRQPGVSLLFYFRTDALLLGILIAFFVGSDLHAAMNPKFLRSPWISVPVVGALIILLAYIGAARFAPINTGLVAVVSAIFVLLASYNENYITTEAKFLQRVTGWLGARSYTLYLVHLPAFWITKIAWAYYLAPGLAFYPDFTLRFVVTAVVVAVLLTELNYRLVEDPMRKLGRRMTDHTTAGRIR